MNIQRSLKREFLLAVIETSRHLRHFVDRKAQQYGLTGAQLRVLSRLRRRQGMVQSELAADLEMRPMSVGSLIDKLAGHGLLERRRDAADRRINRIYLTPAGTEVAQTLDDFRERVAREVLDGIDEAAIASALATLGEIKTRLAVENSIRPNRSPLRPAADEPAESRA
jgi:MarR family transcriptional regulator for hemolysin